jgi:hypothetical protein
MGQKKNENYCVNDTCEGESEYDSFGENESEEETNGATRKKEEERSTAIKEWASKEPIDKEMKALAKIQIMVNSFINSDSNNNLDEEYLLLEIDEIVLNALNKDKEMLENPKYIPHLFDMLKGRFEEIGRKTVVGEDLNIYDRKFIYKINDYLSDVKIPSKYLLISKLELEEEENGNRD